MRSAFLAAAIVAALPGIASAQQVRSAAPDAEAPSASIETLAWLTGTWRAEGLGGPASETYSPVQAGRLTGHFVQEDGKGGIAFTELIHIAPHGAAGKSLAYQVRHFNADMSGWEDKTGKPVVFPLVAIEPDRWYFDGLTIHREASDRMTVHVRVDQGGSVRIVAFRFHRAG